MKNRYKFEEFTPDVPIEFDDSGRAIQVVEGKSLVLSPTTYHRVVEYQAAGLDENEILEWLKFC